MTVGRVKGEGLHPGSFQFSQKRHKMYFILYMHTQLHNCGLTFPLDYESMLWFLYSDPCHTSSRCFSTASRISSQIVQSSASQSQIIRLSLINTRYTRSYVVLKLCIYVTHAFVLLSARKVQSRFLRLCYNYVALGTYLSSTFTDRQSY